MVTQTDSIKIAFFDTQTFDSDSFDKIQKNFDFKITYFKSRLTVETAPLTQGFKVVCPFVNDVIDKDVIDILERNGVALIALRAAGYNNVDLKAIYKKIPVVRVPAYSPFAVAEHAVTLMLSLNRKVHRAYYRTRDDNFTLNGLLGFDMHGKTAGIIGTGKVGKVAVNILKGFGMRVLAVDTIPDKEFQKEAGFEYVDQDTLCKQAVQVGGEGEGVLNSPLKRHSQTVLRRDAPPDRRRTSLRGIPKPSNSLALTARRAVR